MDVIILNQNETELEIQIKGETHTLLNIIKSELLNDNRIETAFYDLKSLQNSVSKDPVLYIKSINNTESTISILKENIDKIINKFDKFEYMFKKSVLNYEK